MDLYLWQITALGLAFYIVICCCRAHVGRVKIRPTVSHAASELKNLAGIRK
jgi:hypothetical protein